MAHLKIDKNGNLYMHSDSREPVYPNQVIPFVDNRFMMDRTHDYNLEKAKKKAAKEELLRQQKAKLAYEQAKLQAQKNYKKLDKKIKEDLKKKIEANRKKNQHIIPAVAQGINAIDFEELYITGCPLTSDGQHNHVCGHLQRNSIFGVPTDYKRLHRVPKADDFGNLCLEDLP